MRLIIECKGQRQVCSLKEGSTIIGRDPACDIVFNDPSLSRHHIACNLHNGELIVKDLDTRNGTWLGSQKIKEARVPPGVSLKAGHVILRFEAEHSCEISADTIACRPDELKEAEPVTGKQQINLSAVPDAEGFDGEDEPTPLAADAVLTPSQDENARLVIRGDRWFVQDPQSGAEVEIVPRGQAGHIESGGNEIETGPINQYLPARVESRVSAPAAGGGFTPEILAQPVEVAPRKWKKILLISGAATAVILIAIVIMATVFKEKPEPLMSSSEYYSRAERAMSLFQNGEPDKAIYALRQLQAARTQRSHQLAEIMVSAIEADQKASQDFSENWEKARDLWSELSDTADGTNSIREAAASRLVNIQREAMNLANFNDAKRALDAGEVAKALELLSKISPKSSIFPQVKALVEQGLGSMEASLLAIGQDKKWEEAIGYLQLASIAAPERKQEFDRRVEEYQRYIKERDAVEAATKLFDDNMFAAAMDRLNQIPADSPYAADVKSLLSRTRQRNAVQLATVAYNAGNGADALKLLQEVGLGESQLASRIKSVVSLDEQVRARIKEAKFDEAQNALNQIVATEVSDDNKYASEAKRMLANMPETIKGTSMLLAETGRQALEKREYGVSRKNYEESLRLDPANNDAIEGLAQLSRMAMREFNIALVMPRKTPDQVDKVLQKLYSVRDCLSPTDKIFASVEAEIYVATKAKEALEKQGD